jgi:predicted amidohydrolase YtcJ
VDYLDQAIDMQAHTGFGSDHLWLGAVKGFADGALGPQTAAMLLPYEGSTTNFGTLQLKADDVFELGMRAVPNGLSLAIHAIGDRATHEVLNGFGMLREYERRMGLPSLNHRIEHLQLMHPDDLLKVRQLDLTASMQPQHATSDRFIAEQYWGSRSKYAYLFKTMVTSGARLIFGSDAPVETPNPFLGIHAAVTRSRPGDSSSSTGWYPDEKLTLAQALEAYSITPAVVAGRSKQFGSLTAGSKADLIVLEQDPFNLPPSELYTVSPSAVMVDGNWVVNHL